VQNLESNEDNKTEKRRRERVVVNGYMRPNGTSYCVVIPKEVRELLGLEDGEYSVTEAKPEKRKIELKLAKISEES